ncbi:MAG: DUF190 domain-containing protein [Scytolyngbya sp. HA4215-MV1]|jgi:hypothetical protein|nr:DUF190 domain-containing protein [Scytolyngbya sp. HA4215-MV1]
MSHYEQLTIYVGESDQWHGKPVYLAIVEVAQQQGLAGATVLRGVAGFGTRQNHAIHTAKILELSSELPMVVIIIDRADAIGQFLPQVKEIVQHGMVIREVLNVVHHAPLNVDPA